MNLSMLPGDILCSFLRVITAVSVAWIFSIIIGMLLHKYPFAYNVSLPVINLIRQISPFVWLPFVIIFIGLGEFPIGVVLFTAMFFPSVIMMYEAFDSFPQDIREEAMTSGATHWQIVHKIELPVLWNQLVNILRILWSVGWTTVIAAEMLGVSRGLGFRLLDFRYLMEYKLMIIYIIVIGIIGIFSDHLLKQLGKLYL